MGQESRVIEVAVGLLFEGVRGCRKVLIARRPHGAILGGYWEFPGGKLEPGETPEQALAREFQEEVGVGVRVDRRLAVIEQRYAHGLVRLHPFICTRVSGQLCDLGVAEHRWVGAGELSGYLFPPANRRLLDWLSVVLVRGEDEVIGVGE
jgi:mutator protein MutT